MANEKRLIDVDKLKSWTCKWCNATRPDEPCEPCDCAIMLFYDGMNTEDAVEVVRCKECKNGELDESERDDYYLCHHHGCDCNDGNHFCSYGERREGE